MRLQLDPLGDATLTADPRRLEQVFLNLIANAVKFTPAGGRVTVGAAVHDGIVDVRVTDTGRGIDPGFLPHVFDRFRQGDAGASRRVGGLGLGLFIARRLVEAHGGTIAAESEGIGQGATFSVRLPSTGTAESHEPAAEAPPPPLASAAPPTLYGVRVLLVDDEPDALEVMSSALETCGASVTTATSARDALDSLARDPFDVLLSDIAMPDADGYDLIRGVRGLAPSPVAQIPAAAVTAFASDEDRRRALAAGFHTHLAKPIAPALLAQTVATLAQRHV